jgi:hypothetical protein
VDVYFSLGLGGEFPVDHFQGGRVQFQHGFLLFTFRSPPFQLSLRKNFLSLFSYLLHVYLQVFPLLLFGCFETRSHYVIQADLEFTILLLQALSAGISHKPPHLALPLVIFHVIKNVHPFCRHSNPTSQTPVLNKPFGKTAPLPCLGH